MTDIASLVREVSAASLVDAMGRSLPHRCHILDLVSPTPDRVLFGQAVTMGFVPHREDLDEHGSWGFARLFYRAIDDAPPDAVLVMASGGSPDVSLGGATKLSRVGNHGLAGILTDGRLRDHDELATYPFTTYCRGETPLAGGGTVMPLTTGVPVVVDRVTVAPGDYVYADRAAAVVIPSSHVSAVLEAAAAIEAEDREAVGLIRDEDPDELNVPER